MNDLEANIAVLILFVTPAATSFLVNRTHSIIGEFGVFISSMITGVSIGELY